MTVFVKTGSAAKNSTLSATSPMPSMKGGNTPTVIKQELDDLMAEAKMVGGKRKSKKSSKKSSKKMKKSSKKSSKKRSKKSSKKRSMKGGDGEEKKKRTLSPALKKYQEMVSKIKEDIIKSGVQLKGIVSINVYVGEYSRQAKSSGAADIEKFVMAKYEDDKKKGVVKKKIEEIEKQLVAKKAAKKAAKGDSSKPAETDSASSD